MNKAFLFAFGSTSTIALSAFIFVLLPRLQVIDIDEAQISAQAPYTYEESLGRKAYVEYGCIYCHSQQVRDPSVGADEVFGWGRPSLPSDYIYDKPHLMGTMRTGPDLSNIGSRQPSRDWHHLHLNDPRSVVSWSIMPDHSFLYEKVKSFKSPRKNAIKIPGGNDEWIIPSEKAENIVLYLQSLKRDQEPVKQERR